MLRVKVFRGIDQWSQLEITKEEPGQIPEGIAPHITLRSHEHLEKQINDWFAESAYNLTGQNIKAIEYRSYTEEGTGVNEAFILYEVF